MTTAITLRSARPTRRWSLRRHDGDITVLRPADIEFTWDNRNPGTSGFAHWIAAAGVRVAERGLSNCARDVDNLVDVARQLDVAPVAIAVLVDGTEPEPARLRAFAAVVSAIANA